MNNTSKNAYKLVKYYNRLNLNSNNDTYKNKFNLYIGCN